MEERLKERLVGATVLVLLAVVFVPMLLDVPQEEREGPPANPIPERPRGGFTTKTISLGEPETPRLDAAIEREHRRHAQEVSAAPRDSVETPATASASTTRDETSSASAAQESATAAQESASAAQESVAAAQESASAAQESASAAQEPVAATQESAAAPQESAAAPQESAAETAGTAPDGWAVQLGSFSVPKNALALRDRLRAKGYTAFIESGFTATGGVSRVFVGPVLDRGRAESSMAKLRREMQLEGIVVRYPGG